MSANALVLTASVVLYKTRPEIVETIISCFSNSNIDYKLYLVDNSPTDELRKYCVSKDCEYIFSGRNLGYGKGNNLAIKKVLNLSKYHLVCNPDIRFDATVLKNLVEAMDKEPDAGLMMPKVFYNDGSVQHLCKMLPTPADLFMRRFLPEFGFARRQNERYEMRASGYNKFMNVPYLSGCFMFLRTSALKDVGLFDERIHLYIEDADLSRRIHQKYKTLFNPEISIYHGYAKGSYKTWNLTFWNIHGASMYFNKWGWFFDRERAEINRKLEKEYLAG